MPLYLTNALIDGLTAGNLHSGVLIRWSLAAWHVKMPKQKQQILTLMKLFTYLRTFSAQFPWTFMLLFIKGLLRRT